MALVSIEKVSKSYWRDSIEIPVLNNISFEISEGAFLGLMGPSGSGKTTRTPLALLEVIPPEKGRILMLEPRRIVGRPWLILWPWNRIGFVR